MTDGPREPVLTGRPWLVGAGLALAVFLADQATKQWAFRLLMDIHDPRVMDLFPSLEVTGFLNLVVVWNTGVSFGLLSGVGASWIFVAISVVVSTVLGGWVLHARSLLIQISLGAIIGGAIGNAIDRILLGAVFDFLDFHWGGYHWYTFNLADCAIVLGALGILVESLFFPEKSDKEKANETIEESLRD